MPALDLRLDLGVHQEKRNILVRNLATRQGLWMIRTSEAEHKVYDLFWASRERLAFKDARHGLCRRRLEIVPDALYFYTIARAGAHSGLCTEG